MNKSENTISIISPYNCNILLNFSKLSELSAAVFKVYIIDHRLPGLGASPQLGTLQYSQRVAESVV